MCGTPFDFYAVTIVSLAIGIVVFFGILYVSNRLLFGDTEESLTTRQLLYLAAVSYLIGVVIYCIIIYIQLKRSRALFEKQLDKLKDIKLNVRPINQDPMQIYSPSNTVD